MRSIKHGVLAVLTALLLCCLTVVSVSAIDTPWIPIAPDSGSATTESKPPVTEAPVVSDTEQATEVITPGSEEASRPQDSTEEVTQPTVDGSEEATKPVPLPQTDEPAATDDQNGGCGGVVTGIGWITVLGGAWMLCKPKHAEKRK